MSDDEKPASTPEGPPSPAPSDPTLPPARKHMPTMLGVGDEASPQHERDVAADAATAAPPPVSEKRQQTGEWGSAGAIVAAPEVTSETTGNREQATGDGEQGDEKAPAPEAPAPEAPAPEAAAAEAPALEAPAPEAPAPIASVVVALVTEVPATGDQGSEASPTGDAESVAPVVETQPGPPVVLTPIADMLLAVDDAPAAQVDEAKVDEAKVDEAKVDEAKVDASQTDDDDVGAPDQETVPIVLPPVAISSPREPIAKAIEDVEQDAAPDADATQEIDAETVPIVPPVPPSARPVEPTPAPASASPASASPASAPLAPPTPASAPLAPPTPAPAAAPPAPAAAYAVPIVAHPAARAATAPKPGLSIVGLLLVLGVFSAAALVFLHRDELKDQPVAPATSASSPSMSPEPMNPVPVVVTANESDAGAAPVGSTVIVERPKVIPKKKAKPKASGAPKPAPPPPL